MKKFLIFLLVFGFGMQDSNVFGMKRKGGRVKGEPKTKRRKFNESKFFGRKEKILKGVLNLTGKKPFAEHIKRSKDENHINERRNFQMLNGRETIPFDGLLGSMGEMFCEAEKEKSRGDLIKALDTYERLRSVFDWEFFDIELLMNSSKKEISQLESSIQNKKVEELYLSDFEKPLLTEKTLLRGLEEGRKSLRKELDIVNKKIIKDLEAELKSKDYLKKVKILYRTCERALIEEMEKRKSFFKEVEVNLRKEDIDNIVSHYVGKYGLLLFDKNGVK